MVAHMPSVDVLIFDMDGVLVDVSQSYREAIRAVPQVFFESVCGLKAVEKDLVTPEIVEAFKLAGGLNNDWDCTAAVTAAFVAVLPQALPKPPLEVGMADYLEILGAWGSKQHVSIEELAYNADPRGLAERVTSSDEGGLGKVLSVSGLTVDTFPVAFGSIYESNVLMRLFQEMYLGPELFETVYDQPPLVGTQQGLIENEQLLISREVLNDLASRLPLGIATGRPGVEAAHALSQHGIGGLFAAVVNEDDVQKAEADELALQGRAVSLSKPDPWSLLEAVRRITEEPVRAAYVGDTPDDIKAARAADVTIPFLAIGTAHGTKKFKKALTVFREAGADVVLAHPDGLKLLDIFGPEKSKGLA